MLLKHTNTGLHEECGVVGIINHPKANYLLYLGLHALQHRGQESSGIVTLEKGFVHLVKKKGSIAHKFNENDVNSLKGEIGLGHVRYSTFGGDSSINIQPFIFTLQNWKYVTSHNGNIVNAKSLKIKLEKKGSIFFSFSDSELLGHLINVSKREKDTFAKLKVALKQLEGAFSFLIIEEDKMYGARDKNGLRPLVLGKIDQGYILASESVALDAVGAKFVRDIEPGEVIQIDKSGKIVSDFYYPKSKCQSRMCAMEYIYFARPDSTIDGLNVHKGRELLGKQLAKEAKVDADIVIGVPDSSLSIALGYSKQSKINYEIGLIKNKYIARSFIAPSQEEREKIVLMKLNPNKQVIKNKRVILVDDSIVRGTTMRSIVKLIHEAGAKEIHIRIASPEMSWPCFYGVDTSHRDELALFNLTKEKYIKTLKYADSLEFLSLKGLESSLGKSDKKKTLCSACFSGKYPTPLHDEKGKLDVEKL